MKKEQLYYIGVKAIIRNPQNLILILKRTGREFWDLPGGRIQEGECANDALYREVKEETGLTQLEKITAHGLFLSSIKIPLEEQSAGLIFYYHSCLIVQAQPIILSPEHSDYLWVGLEKAKTLLSADLSIFFEQNVAHLDG